ncbi:hypothetical protein ACJ6WF_17215 [Streptomyces sp. MMS24-I2-30]|uniref:hypothetical protein n=1 Tax=Streptomyces sp. MMS24-I2-30 TaxID=3351564 RepID=UPI003896CC43
MTDFWRRTLSAVTHRGPGYDVPTRSETDLRAAFTTLADRYEEMAGRAPELPTSLYIDPLTPTQERQHERAVARRQAAADIREVLRSGRIPHDLMTDAEMEQHGRAAR